MSDKEHICFEQIQFAAVTKNGFSDVSIMTVGEADGHGVLIDEKTIEDFIKLAIGKTLPAYLTHDGAQDKDTGRPKDRLGKEIGMFSGFYRDGDKVRARNFQFLEAFQNSEPKTHATLVEMAQKFADKLGISPVVAHLKAWVMGDGDEVIAEAGKSRPSGAVRSLPSMRIGKILSCDFVQKPATNLGLFEAGVDAKPNNNPPNMETIALSEHTKLLSAKDGEIATLSAQHKDAISALETKHTNEVAAFQAKINESTAQLAKASEDAKGLTAALAAKTKEAEDMAKYDMRKAGGEALTLALESRGPKVPEPEATDTGKWNQYATLCEEVKNDRGVIVGHKETPSAKAFKAKFLVSK